MDLKVQVNHYTVLGLPSQEEGVKLSEQDINKAYRSKARELHPDKRRDDPNAHVDFLKLQTSYAVLKDEKARKLFDDDLLRVKREKQLNRQGPQDSKRQKMMSDLEERERSACAPDPTREEEERICQKLKEEIRRIRVMHPLQPTSTSSVSAESDAPKLRNLVGAGYHAFEESVLAKLMKKAAQKPK